MGHMTSLLFGSGSAIHKHILLKDGFTGASNIDWLIYVGLVGVGEELEADYWCRNICMAVGC